MSNLTDVVEALKHLPGQHDQKTHAGAGGGQAGAHLAKLEQAVAADKNIKKHVSVLRKKLDGISFQRGIGGRHPFSELEGDVRGEVHSAVVASRFKQAGGDKYEYAHTDGTRVKVGYDRRSNYTRLQLIPKGSEIF